MRPVTHRGAPDHIVLPGCLDDAPDPRARLREAARLGRGRTRVSFELRQRRGRDAVGELVASSGLELVALTPRVVASRRPAVRDRIVARPAPQRLPELTVSVICPCRNEAGNVREVIERLPPLGAATELIFVEGGSTDGTRAEIQRQIALHPDRDVRLLANRGTGKGAGVRTGFDAAKHEALMILDGDVSVAPEDLPAFYDVLVSGRGELVNGSRLVLQMEPGAMRFLNRLANRAFARLFGLITGQLVTDTLCGTKVLLRRDYEAMSAAGPALGSLDPFGDFDLLFGAAQRHLRILDVPVRYRARRYGRTNIHRFRDGARLGLLALVAFVRLRRDLERTVRVSGARGRGGSGTRATGSGVQAPARGVSPARTGARGAGGAP